MGRKVFALLLVLVTVFIMGGCGASMSISGLPDPEKIVPKREVLVENLEGKGYKIEALTSVEGSDLVVDRVLAQKGNRFIDIVYGLSAEDAATVFELYSRMYPDDYYILARNGNFVYCVSDKGTFRKAGFTTTANVGEQWFS